MVRTNALIQSGQGIFLLKLSVSNVRRIVNTIKIFT